MYIIFNADDDLTMTRCQNNQTIWLFRQVPNWPGAHLTRYQQDVLDTTLCNKVCPGLRDMRQVTGFLQVLHQ